MNATEMPATVRGHSLAAIHAATAFLVEAQTDDVPMPDSVEMRFHQHEGDSDARVAYVEAFAERFGLTVQRGDKAVWAVLPLVDNGPTRVSLTVQTHAVDQPW